MQAAGCIGNLADEVASMRTNTQGRARLDATARKEIISQYERWLDARPDLMAALPELRSTRLGSLSGRPSPRAHYELMPEQGSSGKAGCSALPNGDSETRVIAASA
jgi:hypothetical protein